jgi:hypothetical protein
MPDIRQRASLSSQEKVKEMRTETAIVTESPGMAPM